MKVKKWSFLIVLAILLVITGSGAVFYHNHLSEGINFSLNNSGKDDLKVYDAKYQLLNEITGKKATDDFLSKLDTGYQAVKNEPVPKDAKVSYKYVVHQRKHNIKITIITYANYKIAKVAGVPLIGKGVIHLSKAEFNELNHPNLVVNK